MIYLKILIGQWDYGSNGHGYFDYFYIESNAESVDQIKAAYAEGVAVVGVDIQSKCAEYEANIISVEDFLKIKSLAPSSALTAQDDETSRDGEYEGGSKGWIYGGLYGEVFENIDIEEDEEIILNSEQYFALWRAIVQIGERTLLIRAVNERIQCLDIGGYGVAEPPEVVVGEHRGGCTKFFK